MYVLNVSRVGIMSFPSVFEGLILGNFLGCVCVCVYLKLVIMDEF